MANRRDFLSKGVVGGAALAAVGAINTACAPPPGEPGVATGYEVGQRLPVLAGANQYGGTSSSSEFLGSYVLLDLCPWWCGPCRFSATHQADFIRYVRSRGVDLRLLSVVTELAIGDPATRFDAERWAARFGLNSEITLHSNSDAASPLLDVAQNLATANGAGSAGYPTYALLDPSGVIRRFQQSSDLNPILSALAALTSKNLNGQWPPTGPIVPVDPFTSLGSLRAIGKDAAGNPIDRVAAWPDGDFGPLGISIPGFNSAFTALEGIDPDTPLTLTVQAATPPPGQRFVRKVGISAAFALVGDDAFTETGVDLSKLIYGSGTVTTSTDGVALTIPPISSLLGGQPLSSRTFFQVILATEGSGQRWSMPFTLTEQLVTDIESGALPAPDAAIVTANLQAVLSNLANRKYAPAAAAGRSALDASLSSASYNLYSDLTLLTQILDAAVIGV